MIGKFLIAGAAGALIGAGVVGAVVVAGAAPEFNTRGNRFKPLAYADLAPDQKAFADKDFRQRIYDQGSEPVGNSPEAFKAFIAAEYQRWGELIRAAGIKLE